MTSSVFLIPEIACSDLNVSLPFYTEILGFRIQYQREDEGFVMLERQGACLMVDEINHAKRLWLTAPLVAPFGRGINLQIKTNKIDALYGRIQNARQEIFLPIEDKCYRAADQSICQRQFIVLDPDGYMLRFIEYLPAL